jgi:hypothetical protein
MTRFDLHPEELLERAQRGTISAADRARLEQHLGECTVCRVERALATQAALDVAPLRDEELLLARLKRDVGARLEALPGLRARRKRAVVVVALLAASVASVATAATVVVMRRAASSREIVVVAPVPKADQARRAAAPVVVPTPTPASEAPSPAEAMAVDPPRSAELPAKPAAADVTSAAEAFSRANLARRDGKVKEAVRLYRTLQERFAGSSEELVSRVALGRLLLDRLGDSRGALVQFNSYLASPGSGALREEAMVGRALALGRLGRGAEERAAWSALVVAWPKSAHAKHAQARLAELDRKPGAGGR